MRDAFDESDLLRLVEGDCSPDEAARLQAWVAADPGRARLLDQIHAVWRATGTATRRWDIAAARKRLDAARSPIRTALHTWPLSGWRLKAAVAASAVFVIAVWQLFPRGPRATEHVTVPGQRSHLTLLDGTGVVLSVDSRLRVPKDYGVVRRAVELEGEAYFVVRHDSARPFLVRTAQGSVEVVGTEFNVRVYPGERLEVVVVAGEVALRAKHDAPATTLRPRDRGVIDASGVVTVTPDVVLNRDDPSIGELVFNDERLDSAIERLGRLYGLRIALGDTSLAQQRVTLTLSTSADEGLAELAKALNLEVAVAGRSACISIPPPPAYDPTYSAAVPSGWRCPKPPQ